MELSERLALVERFKLPTQRYGKLMVGHTYKSGSDDSTLEQVLYMRQDAILGKGQYGEVFLEEAQNECLLAPRLRAVKEISKAFSIKHQVDWRRELEAMATLSTPQCKDVLVQLLGWYEDEKTVYLAMEYFELKDLSFYLKSIDDEDEIRCIARQLAAGLRIMHEEKFTHRDLSPKNIFVAAKGPHWRVKIADFGVAKRPTEMSGLWTVQGTRGYMAPEYSDFVRNGPECPDPTCAVDLWSLGCVIYELFVKDCPFKVEDSAFRKYCVNRVLPHEFEASFASEEAQNVVQVLLDPRPEYRITAEDLLATSWLSEESASTPTMRAENPQINFSSLNLNDISHPPPHSMYSCHSSQVASSISLTSTSTLFDPPDLSRVGSPLSSISSYSELRPGDEKPFGSIHSPFPQRPTPATSPRPTMTPKPQRHHSFPVPDAGQGFAPTQPAGPAFSETPSEMPELHRFATSPMPDIRKESNPPMPTRPSISANSTGYPPQQRYQSNVASNNGEADAPGLPARPSISARPSASAGPPEYPQPQRHPSYPAPGLEIESTPTLPTRPSPGVSSNDSPQFQRHQSVPSIEVEAEITPSLPPRRHLTLPLSHPARHPSPAPSTTTQEGAINSWIDSSSNPVMFTSPNFDRRTSMTPSIATSEFPPEYYPPPTPQPPSMNDIQHHYPPPSGNQIPQNYPPPLGNQILQNYPPSSMNQGPQNNPPPQMNQAQQTYPTPWTNQPPPTNLPPPPYQYQSEYQAPPTRQTPPMNQPLKTSEQAPPSKESSVEKLPGGYLHSFCFGQELCMNFGPLFAKKDIPPVCDSCEAIKQLGKPRPRLANNAVQLCEDCDSRYICEFCARQAINVPGDFHQADHFLRLVYPPYTYDLPSFLSERQVSLTSDESVPPNFGSNWMKSDHGFFAPRQLGSGKLQARFLFDAPPGQHKVTFHLRVLVNENTTSSAIIGNAQKQMLKMPKASYGTITAGAEAVNANKQDTRISAENFLPQGFVEEQVTREHVSRESNMTIVLNTPTVIEAGQSLQVQIRSAYNPAVFKGGSPFTWWLDSVSIAHFGPKRQLATGGEIQKRKQVLEIQQKMEKQQTVDRRINYATKAFQMANMATSLAGAVQGYSAHKAKKRNHDVQLLATQLAFAEAHQPGAHHHDGGSTYGGYEHHGGGYDTGSVYGGESSYDPSPYGATYEQYDISENAGVATVSYTRFEM